MQINASSDNYKILKTFKQLGTWITAVKDQISFPGQWHSYLPDVLSSRECYQLVNILCANSFLSDVNLEGKYLAPECASALAILLFKNFTLKTLQLQKNELGPIGATIIADALSSAVCNITELNLSLNDIGFEGAKSVSLELKKNRCIKTLYLGGNGIGSAGAATLAEALICNTTLTQLYLGLNEIDHWGGEALAEALKLNRTLELLNLSNNQLGVVVRFYYSIN